MLQERDIFQERQEIKRANFSCPHCRQRNDYEVRWLKRVKRNPPPRNMSPDDRARFNNSRDYMVRLDDMLGCKNPGCRRRFEIPNSQSVVFI
jgi:hypothetical protein